MGDRQAVIIVGAGIGGLTAALALERAGHPVIVVERAPELTEVGAGIQLSPNAGRVLAGLGLDEAIGKASIEPRAIDIRNGLDGRPVVAVPVGTFRGRYGFPYRVIHRADLQSVLAREVRRRSGIDLRLGATVLDVLDKGRTLLVKVPRGTGTEVVKAHGIIGADGVWSTTRKRIADAASPKPSGRTAWRAVIPLDNMPRAVEADRVVLWLGRDAHLVHYPVAGGAAVNMVAIIEEVWDRPGWSAPGDRGVLAEHFAGWSREVREIVNAPFSWQKWAITAVDPAGSWVSPTTALLGDAAHAMPPFLAQGAAMAIEDAAVLARAIDGHAEAADAFRAYEAERKPRVARVWKAAWRTGEHYHFGGRLAGLRDFALGLLGPNLILSRNDWIYCWKPE